jgi:hypothetical protein
MQNKLHSLEEFLRMQILTDRAQRMRDGDGHQARRRRFLLKFLTYRCIEDTTFFTRERLLFIPLLISIPLEALIHGGKGTKGSSTFVSDLGGSTF